MNKAAESYNKVEEDPDDKTFPATASLDDGVKKRSMTSLAAMWTSRMGGPLPHITPAPRTRNMTRIGTDGYIERSAR